MNIMSSISKRATVALDKPKRVVLGLNFARKFIRLVDNPNDTGRVFEMEQAAIALAGDQYPAKMLRSFQRYPAAMNIASQRILAPGYTLADLKEYAPHTLGGAYYHHMTSHNFEIDFFPPLQPDDEINVVKLRMRQTHDIWHVVTGYGTDIPGEIGLQGFYMGQYAMVFPALLISASILHVALKDTRNLDRLFELMVEGWQRGKAAKSLWDVRWEDKWELPIEEIRAELGVIPAKEVKSRLEIAVARG